MAAATLSLPCAAGRCAATGTVAGLIVAAAVTGTATGVDARVTREELAKLDEKVRVGEPETALIRLKFKDKADKAKVDDFDDLYNALDQHRPGDKVDVKVMRGEQAETLKLEVIVLP